MKVLIVGLATFQEMHGGSARYLSDLVDGLSRAGHDVVVLTSAGTTRTARGGRLGQLVRAVKRVALFWPRVARALYVHRPDVVNVHFALDGVPAALLARASGAALVVTFHGPWALETDAMRRRPGSVLTTGVRRSIEWFVYRSASRIVVLSEAFRDLLCEHYAVPRERTRVVPGGIRCERFPFVEGPAEARRRLGLGDRFTVVAVRRLVPRMGLDLAVEATAMLLEDGDLQLVIAGAGPESSAIVDSARAKGADGRLEMLGRVPDDVLADVYAAGDVCVVPSRSLEGFGYGALEALSVGTPVVATAVGGLVELVGGLDRSWIVPPDARAIAEAVARLRDRDDRPAVRAMCRAYAERFDWSRVLPMVVAVLEEAIAAAGAGRGGAGRGPSPGGSLADRG